MSKHLEIKISGRVQGVFFRQGIKDKAEELGLTGWVRNEPDGSVRVAAEGPEENLQKLIEWCRKGTELARIDKIEAEWGEARGKFDKFEIW